MSGQRFYLIRHGETDWNKAQRFQGHSDIGLNREGIEQALKIKAEVAKLSIDLWVSSDLSRAVHTAELLTDRPGEIPQEPRLRELYLGQAEGLTKEVIAQKWPEVWMAWQSLQIKDWEIRFPSGESRVEMLKRFEMGLFHHLNENKNRSMAFVSHGGAIRSLVHKLRPDFTKPYIIPNCAVVPFLFKDEKLKFDGPDTPEQLISPLLSK